MSLFWSYIDVFKGKKRDIGFAVIMKGLSGNLWEDEFIGCLEFRKLGNSYIDVLDPKKGDIGLENTHNLDSFP